MSIRKQMILYFSCVMVVIFTLTELINGWQAYRQLEKNMTASVKELLNLSVKNMDYYFQDTSNVCSSIMADERIFFNRRSRMIWTEKFLDGN